MTTIAYDLKRREVACDGRMVETNSGDIATDEAIKAHERCGLLMFMAGDVAGIDEVANAFVACSHRVRRGLHLELLVWNGFKLFEVAALNGLMQWHEVVSSKGAIGCGAAYAVAALDSGATPRAAVVAAAKRNCFTGGKIRVYKLEGKV